MKVILCVRLKNWPIDRWKRAQRRQGWGDAERRKKSEDRSQKGGVRQDTDAPVVAVANVKNRREIVAVSSAAAEIGIRRGMTLGQARSFCTHVEWFDHDAATDKRAVEALGRWMMRFTPVVMPVGMSAIFLDVTGCERVFGGFDVIVRRVIQAMAALGISARVAGAPTMGAAWALTFAGGENGRITKAQELIEAVAELPAWTLRIGPEVSEALHQLGIETVGQLVGLPRAALPARFGADVLRRMDQAIGSMAEPVVPLAHRSPIEASREFDGPIGAIEGIWAVMKELIGRVTKELERRGGGARTIRLEFWRPYGTGWGKTVELSRASRDERELFRLLECARETMTPSDGDGWWGVRVRVTAWQRTGIEQRLFSNDGRDGEHDLGRLMERLQVRCGTEQVAGVELVESHWPEWAWRETEAGEKRRTAEVGNWVKRPLRLESMPREVSVIVTPSEDRDGRPAQIVDRRGARRVAQAVGPERIEGVWWEGVEGTRDYFDVEDESGRRWWVFRENQTRKWYVHGTFE